MNSKVNTLPSLVAVVGPTASGKTDVALALAQKFSGEVIVADSRQIYEGVDIASNKTPGTKQKDGFFIDGIAYHGLDLVTPDDVLTVQQWKNTTLETIGGILERSNLPIIEGGTGLYVQALLDNYDFPDAPPDEAIRKRLEAQAAEDGIAALADELLRRDPDALHFLDIENPRRVIRALEVIETTGEPFSKQRGQGEKLFNDLRLGMHWDMNALDDRIEARAKEQIAMGLEHEARGMLEQYGTNLPAMTSIGYTEWIPYLDGEISRDEVLDKNIRRNKRLARAQLKWFKRDPSIVWIRSVEEALEQTERFLKK